jgi:hypothetical protein
MPVHRALLVTCCCTALPIAAMAQRGALRGRITGDSAGQHPIAAEVAIPALGRSTRANANGVYQLDGLPTGDAAVVVRLLGLIPVFDTVAVVDGQEVVRNYVLGARAQTLAEILVTAEEDLSYMSEFEAWRRGRRGQFLGPAELRTMDDQPLVAILLGMRGTRLVGYRGMSFLTMGLDGRFKDQTRGRGGRGEELPRAIPTDESSPRGCWVETYVNREKLYTPGSGVAAPDMSQFTGRYFNGIELYTEPGEPHGLIDTFGWKCGTVVLWLRHP